MVNLYPSSPSSKQAVAYSQNTTGENFWKPLMSDVGISAKGQILLTASVRKALGLKPGMWVNVKINGKGVQITPARTKKTVSLKEIQSLLKYGGPAVAVGDMRVNDHKG
jgi:bifunctional DNA-binding transcriptional regulator/antitoxin component of YhaV-PrlF toxin-antitoxin module